jgi:hypothetical protein
LASYLERQEMPRRADDATRTGTDLVCRGRGNCELDVCVFPQTCASDWPRSQPRADVRVTGFVSQQLDQFSAMDTEMITKLTPETLNRPTPLHPYPEPSKPAKAVQPGPKTDENKKYPPELGPDALSILDGRTFMISNALGDVPAGSVGGLLHNDTRFISRWELTIGGKPLSLLKSSAVDYYSAAFHLTNPDLPSADLLANNVAIRRMRFIDNSLYEEIVALNSSNEPENLDPAAGLWRGFRGLLRSEGRRARSKRPDDPLVGEGDTALPLRGAALCRRDDDRRNHGVRSGTGRRDRLSVRRRHRSSTATRLSGTSSCSRVKR